MMRFGKKSVQMLDCQISARIPHPSASLTPSPRGKALAGAVHNKRQPGAGDFSQSPVGCDMGLAVGGYAPRQRTVPCLASSRSFLTFCEFGAINNIRSYNANFLFLHGNDLPIGAGAPGIDQETVFCRKPSGQRRGPVSRV